MSNQSPSTNPRFFAGDPVTVKATGRKGTVVRSTFRDGRWLFLVDQSHGSGVLRQHYPEEELE